MGMEWSEVESKALYWNVKKGNGQEWKWKGMDCGI